MYLTELEAGIVMFLRTPGMVIHPGVFSPSDKRAIGRLIKKGMVERSGDVLHVTALAPKWCPRPHLDSTDASRRAYYAGYGDGFRGHPFASGEHGDFSDYRVGFADGRADA